MPAARNVIVAGEVEPSIVQTAGDPVPPCTIERVTGSEEEAVACDAFLQQQGLIVRRVAGYKLPHCLRITVGDEASCRRVAHAVAQFKGVK